MLSKKFDSILRDTKRTICALRRGCLLVSPSGLSISQREMEFALQTGLCLEQPAGLFIACANGIPFSGKKTPDFAHLRTQNQVFFLLRCRDSRYMPGNSDIVF